MEAPKPFTTKQPLRHEKKMEYVVATAEHVTNKKRQQHINPPYNSCVRTPGEIEAYRGGCPDGSLFVESLEPNFGLENLQNKPHNVSYI